MRIEYIEFLKKEKFEKSASLRSLFSMFMVLFFSFSTSVFAQSNTSISIDPNQKFTYACDRIEVDNILQGARLLGNVVIVHGDMILNADVIVLRYNTKQTAKKKTDEGDAAILGSMTSTGSTEIQTLTASGRVTFVRKDQRAVCRQAVYNESSRTLTLTGKPQLWQGTSSLSGDRILVYLDKEKIEVTGRKNTRVSGSIVPSSMQPGLDEEAAKRLEDLKLNPPPDPDNPSGAMDE